MTEQTIDLEQLTAALTGPTLGEQIAAAIATTRGGAKRHGDNAWLARQVEVGEMAVSRYVRDISIPEAEIAARVAEVLGWTNEEMQTKIQAARLRRVMGKGR